MLRCEVGGQSHCGNWDVTGQRMRGLSCVSGCEANELMPGSWLVGWLVGLLDN